MDVEGAIDVVIIEKNDNVEVEKKNEGEDSCEAFESVKENGAEQGEVDEESVEEAPQKEEVADVDVDDNEEGDEHTNVIEDEKREEEESHIIEEKRDEEEEINEAAKPDEQEEVAEDMKDEVKEDVSTAIQNDAVDVDEDLAVEEEEPVPQKSVEIDVDAFEDDAPITEESNEAPGKTDDVEAFEDEAPATEVIQEAPAMILDDEDDINKENAGRNEPNNNVKPSLMSSLAKFGQPAKAKGMFKVVQTEKCAACDKTVYAMEKLEMNGHIYHRNCFKCSHCSARLTPKTFSMNEGVIFCITHFKQLFARKGNYDEGFGRLQYKKKWGGEKGDGATA